MSSLFSCSELLESLLAGKDLNSNQATELMNSWLSEKVEAVQTGAILVALRSKGLTGIELASMAKVLIDACPLPSTLPQVPLVDTCGTGGDGADTFNISTAVAFLAASCGANVAKHGNRSASGKVGSADVLEGLGLRLNAPLDVVVNAVDNAKITFLFAPAWHSSLINLAPLRKSLGIRTVFNLLGPLVNPLRPKAQVLGVAKYELLDPMAEALNKIGLDRAVVIYGAGGLDEASLEGANHVRFIENGNISSTIVEPSHLGLSNCANAELKGGDLKTNIEILSNLLKGSGTKAQQEVVALNNSFVLWASGLETDLTLGVNKSLNSLKSGEGWLVLERLRTFLDDKSCD
tara:strand:- start:3346 stop:4389 length:1044 start_codon:yes stop_codon:yes gene_type:complete